MNYNNEQFWINTILNKLVFCYKNIKILARIFPNTVYLVILQQNKYFVAMSKDYRTKVILVHFIHGRKNYFFGSVAAIFKKFGEKQLGCTKQTLNHILTHDGSSHITPEAYFYRSHLIQSPKGLNQKQ